MTLFSKEHCDKLLLAVAFNVSKLPKEAYKNKLLIQTNSEKSKIQKICIMVAVARFSGLKHLRKKSVI
jgi:hypothetical protein